MSYIVLDTDVWSFLFKQDTRAELYRDHIQGQIPCISFQTVAELYQWAEKADWGTNRRERLESWLKGFVVLGYDLNLSSRRFRTSGRMKLFTSEPLVNN